MNLSAHFTLAEATKSQTATRLGIDNTPPDWMMPKLVDVAEKILEPVRVHFERPFVPSSWYRSPELNKAIGGSTTSQHSKGEAVDFEVPGISNIVLAKWIASEISFFDQLILECWTGGNTGWVHCSVIDGANRRDILTFNGKSYSKRLPQIQE